MSLAENVSWLRGLYRRFEEDAALLHKIEPFWRACLKCPDGYCCTKSIYSAWGNEGNPFLGEDWWMMLEYVRDHFTVEDKRRLARRILSPRPDCVFLFDSRCSIHPARPWVSRTHPYTVSFHPNAALFPVAQVALPSCPAYASSLDVKRGQLLVQKAQETARDKGGHLVQLKVRKHKPLWFIDATAYLQEYESRILSAERPQSEWIALFTLARQAGGEHGELLARYVEQVTERKPTVEAV